MALEFVHAKRSHPASWFKIMKRQEAEKQLRAREAARAERVRIEAARPRETETQQALKEKAAANRGFTERMCARAPRACARRALRARARFRPLPGRRRR